MIVSAAAVSVQAQTTANWIGPASGGEWNTPADWDTGAPPLDPTTNAVVGPGTNVNYNVPMTAASFGTLANKGVLNINATGFNSAALTMINPGGTGKLFINNGGAEMVNGNLAYCSNSIVSVAAGGSLTINGTLIVGAGASGGTSSGTGGSFGMLTNNGGTISANATSLNPGNGSVTTGSLVVINGGTNNLGNVIVKRSAAGSGGYSTLGTEGLMIYGGQVTTSNLNVGGPGGNSFLSAMVGGGIVTNYGSVYINQGTASRGSRLLQTNGLFVVPDPNVVNPNPTVSGSLNVYSVTGGTNIVGGFYFGNSNSSAGTVNFTNAAVMYVGSQGINWNGVVTLNAALNNGGLLGATAPWTGSAAMILTSGSFTFKTADLNNNANNITLSGVLSGNGGLNLIGNGVLTLNAANTYVGKTYIGGGTLALGSSGVLTSPQILVGSGSIFDVSQVSGYTLAANQTLMGFGTVNGAVTAASTATIYPGSNTVTGTLTFAGGLTENGGVNNTLNLSGNPSGPNNDFINASGGLTVTGTNVISLVGSLATCVGYENKSVTWRLSMVIGIDLNPQ